MQKITTYLTFKDHAEEAIMFYVGLFSNSKILSLTRNEGETPIPKGSLLNGQFILDGQYFMAMDGGEPFEFAMGSSLFVKCETQEEVDKIYDALLEGGKEMACGWVTDRYGVIWQIVPSVLMEFMQDEDPVKSKRVMAAMMKMKKLDIATLRDAYDGVHA